jgi:hypothetical protein
MDYQTLEDFIFELRDEYLEFSVKMPDFIQADESLPMVEKCDSAFRELQTTYRIPDFQGIGKITEIKFPEKIHAIRSMVGDDETVTTNCLMYAVLCVIIGPILARIKISWSDVQFNKELYNYAEGWVLVPPSMDSSFESVNRYAKNNGVPFVLDPIKFKNLSAVRKQSDMEVDLPSKFKSLAQTAAWTDRSWFTWDMHQMALLLGLQIFDFTKSKLFPYLYRWEGGCGGGPPWGNLLTAAGAIFRYRRGGATRGILGVMSDSNNLHTGNIKPADALFAKNLNLALSGDSKWLTIRSELERRKKDAADLGLPYSQKTTEVAEKVIPGDLMNKSQVVMPDDALTGVAVSFLRDKGYVKTELDLVTYVEDRNRLNSVWGYIPLQEIEDQIALRKREYADAFLETLTELTRGKKLDSRVYGVLGDIEDPMSPWALAVMGQYYRMRVEQTSHFTSFIYNEQVRVFKTEDVEEFYAKGMESIRDGFCESVASRYRPDFRRSIQLPKEERLYDEIEQWLSSDNLSVLLTREIPPGIGPDDARICRDAASAARNDRNAGATGLLYLVISSDRRLVSSVQSILQHENPDLFIRVVAMNVIEFIAYCTTPFNWYNNQRDPPWLRGLHLYNPYRRRNEPVYGALLGALRREARFLFNCPIVSGRVFYDYPNLNRNLRRFLRDGDSGPVTEMSGGFLTRARAMADNQIAVNELAHTRRLVDFLYMYKRVVAPIERRPARLYSAKQGRNLQEL